MGTALRGSILTKVVIRGLASALASLSFLTFLFTGYAWLAAALAVAAAAALLVDRRLRPRAGTSVESVVLGTGAIIGAERLLAGPPGVALVLAACAMLGLVTLEHPLRAIADLEVRVAHLRLRRWWPPVGRHLPTVNIALALAMAGCAGLSVEPWPVAGAGLATGAAAGAEVTSALRRRLRPSNGPSELRRALERHQPTFVLYFSGPPGSAYQVTMWLPYLERIGRPYFVMLREAEFLPTVAAATSAPVVVCPTLAAIDQAMVPSLKTAFYVNHAAKNGNCVRFSNLTHIQIHHGDSDKATSYTAVSAMFDRNFVAGQAAIDRYERHGVAIPRDRFRIVGRPQVEAVRRAAAHVRDLVERTVLYAPTWTGHFTDVNYSSLPAAERLIRHLLEWKATVILRPHPYSWRNPESARQLAGLEAILMEDVALTGRRHIFGAKVMERLSMTECMNRSDALVSDVSSVASDYLYSGKPMALTDMVGAGADFARNFPMARAAYVLDSDMANVDDVLTDLLQEDPLHGVRAAIRSYYLGDLPVEGYAATFVTEARRYC
jgi:hypothetical protein